MILGYDTQSRYSDETTPSIYLLLSLEPTLNEFALLKKKVLFVITSVHKFFDEIHAALLCIIRLTTVNRAYQF